jgi:hypothetical protein
MLKIDWFECRDGMDDSDFENGYKNDVATISCGDDKIFANVEGDSESGSYAIWFRDGGVYPLYSGETKSYRSAKVMANKKVRELYRKRVSE